MRYLILFILFFITIEASQKDISIKYVADKIPKNMTLQIKKDRFYYLLVPAIEEIYEELYQNYAKVKNDIEQSKNLFAIDYLKVRYGVTTDKELLAILKPHPKSIALAQAAIESGWATSRFFVEANNVFGIWSVNKNEPRVAANHKRANNKTVFLKKFRTIKESVRAYYMLLSRGKAFKEFRKIKLQSDDVFEIVKKLDKYSELGELYTQGLSRIIRYNNLLKYD